MAELFVCVFVCVCVCVCVPPLPSDPITGQEIRSGKDLRARRGESVLAAIAGTLAKADRAGGGRRLGGGGKDKEPTPKAALAALISGALKELREGDTKDTRELLKVVMSPKVMVADVTKCDVRVRCCPCDLKRVTLSFVNSKQLTGW
jgi:hypothetical protein